MDRIAIATADIATTYGTYRIRLLEEPENYGIGSLFGRNWEVTMTALEPNARVISKFFGNKDEAKDYFLYLILPKLRITADVKKVPRRGRIK